MKPYLSDRHRGTSKYETKPKCKGLTKGAKREAMNANRSMKKALRFQNRIDIENEFIDF